MPACGPGAVLSHRSAGLLWGVLTTEGPSPDITSPAHRRTPGVRCHTAALTRTETAVHQRIPVTSPARTLADLAHVLTDDDLTRAVREAQFRRLFHLPAMLAVLDRRPSRHLRRLMDDLNATQSHLEDRLLHICRRSGLPSPITQQRIHGRRVDFVWPAHRVVVETDGYEGHATPSAFQRDRSATNRLQLAGYTGLRFTHADVTRRPAEVAEQIRSALAL